MKKYFKFIVSLVALLVIAIVPAMAQEIETVVETTSGWQKLLQFIYDNWMLAASFIGGSLIKETWVLAVNAFIKKTRVIIGKVKSGLENTDEFLDVLEGVTDDGKINKDEIIESIEAGKEYFVEQKGIIISFKKKK